MTDRARGSGRSVLPRAIAAIAVGSLLTASGAASQESIVDDSASAVGLAIGNRVEIVRTEFGIPHIYAEDLEAMGFALAWVQSEDYGDRVAVGMMQRRGVLGRALGIEAVASDLVARETHARATETFPTLSEEVRSIYRGFAEGINHYVRLHPEVFPSWVRPDFTAIDASTPEVYAWSRGDATAFVRAYRRRAESSTNDALPASWLEAEQAEAAFDEELDGSNAWALDASRTTSGHAILLRNPHLSWNAGYYEAHIRIPDVMDFYGDFRIGGAFGIIGGFNRHLGWATTNNSPKYSQVYALPKASARSIRLDGTVHPLRDSTLTAEYVTEHGTYETLSETTLWSDWGPVIHESDEHVFVLKDPRDGAYRRGEQLLSMMTAESLDEWLDIMRMREHASSNFTYADADGNIALYYNARIPNLPHEPTGDSAAYVQSASQIWTQLAPWESLPLYINPPGGYVQQANDTPDFINLNVTLDRDTVAPNLPAPRLRLRSQLSFDLIHGDDRLSLEEVVRRKHSPRMLAAERTLDDLLAAIDATEPTPGLTRARAVLGEWDRTASAESRGGVLFREWYLMYQEVAGSQPFRRSWDADHPVTTPVGVGRPGRAIAALRMTLEELAEDGWTVGGRWGDRFRVIRGSVDEPVSGCDGSLGCFRTLSFAETEDGRRAVNRGDGWVFAVEFGDVPRGYTVLAYGQSDLPDSPHFDDQAAMFARGEMKPVLWLGGDIESAAIRRYRPGVIPGPMRSPGR